MSFVFSSWKIFGWVCRWLALAAMVVACGGGKPAENPDGVVAQDQATAFQHDGAGICVPHEIGPFVHRENHDFGPGDLGASYFDQKHEAIITIYVYPSEGLPLDQHFQQVVQEMINSSKVGSASTAEFEDPRFGKGLIGAVGFEREDVELLSAAFLLTDGEWFYKVRATFPAVFGDEMKEAIAGVIVDGFRTCGAVMAYDEGAPRRTSPKRLVEERHATAHHPASASL